VFARKDQSETVVVAFNRSEQEKKVTVPIGLVGVKDGADIVGLIGSRTNARVVKGKVTLPLPGRSAVAFKAL
jgi:hypothetical protein